jgi:hypothetical protein
LDIVNQERRRRADSRSTAGVVQFPDLTPRSYSVFVDGESAVGVEVSAGTVAHAELVP